MQGLMELAVHLREPLPLETFEGVWEHLTALYGEAKLESELRGIPLPEQPRRMYVGDEFCLHRLPDPEELGGFVRQANELSWAVTLLTPPVTDEGLEKCAPLFDRLDGPHLGAEVVVNDWGALQYVREKHPCLPVSLGRLLNKGFKDPRLPDAGTMERVSEEAADLLNRCTFDFARFQEEMVRLKVSRLERDLLPYGTPRLEIPEGLGVSVYFPFGYVTMGRVCWLATFEHTGTRKFSLAKGCPRTCRDMSLRLKDAQRNLLLYQEGNAIFSLYPPSLLASFIRWATDRAVRFVYQGLAIGVR